jgi:hypothetical protein
MHRAAFLGHRRVLALEIGEAAGAVKDAGAGAAVAPVIRRIFAGEGRRGGDEGAKQDGN